MAILGAYHASNTVIGEGTNSVVFYGERLVDRLPVAIKLTDPTVAVEREISILQLLARSYPTSKAFPRLLEVVDLPNKRCLVFEYIAGTTLLALLEAHPHGLSEEYVSIIVGRVASALSLVHELGIAHRDIKLENIMVTDAGRVVLLDFGLAHVCERGALTRVCSGSLHYVPAEVVKGLAHDPFVSDLYSLGVTLYALLCNRFPFAPAPIATSTSASATTSSGLPSKLLSGAAPLPRASLNKLATESLFAAILRGYVALPTSLSLEASTLVLALLRSNPADRPTLNEVLLHPFVSGIRSSSCSTACRSRVLPPMVPSDFETSRTM